MRRMQAFILLVLAVIPLLAQAWCTMPPPANPGPAQPQMPNVAHACWPAKWGLPFLTGKGYVESDIAAVPGATSEGGHCAAWWCQDAAGAWNVESHCALASYTVGGISAGLAAALGTADPVAALQAFADSYVVTLTDPGQINSYNCLHWSIQQQAQATKPVVAPPVYVANGGTIFTASAGRITGITGRKAAAGAPLDCALTKVTNTTGGISTDYCALAGGSASEVTQAKKP